MYSKKLKLCDAQFITDNLNYYKIDYQLNIDNCGNCYINIKSINPGDIHAVCTCFLPPSDIDHHTSDLYIKVTKESKKIIEILTPKSLLSSFISQLDGCRWFDLPFCYNPIVNNGGIKQ